ncbi:MAG TPA: ABC transporter substrate-binding protein [Baekduia sp.]|uniref:ABC transporter substrate-binding protein n=1 Tax=Baekduia sp. TaxID=2600305 RepID=UPI002C3D8299|nr:ABC transporter substrate-binding protein [Baekduia sp.]HMJ37849.1 ABC transporter substrate-binding protein [Baekduia sp.]
MGVRGAWFAGCAAPLAVGLAFTLAACGGSDSSSADAGSATSSGSSKQVVKIAGIVPLSGPYAAAGTGAINGMKAAVEYLNAGGTTSGSSYKLDTLDDQSDPTKAALATRKLLGSGTVMAIPVGTPGSGAATQPILNQAKILFGGPNSIELNPADMKPGGADPLSFQSGPSLGQFAEAQIRYAAETLKLKKVGQLYEADAVGKVFVASAQAAAKKYGVQLVTKSFQPTQTDVTAQLRSLQGSGVQALALWAYGTPQVSAVQSLGKMTWRPDVLSTLGGASPSVVALVRRQAPDLLGKIVLGPIATTYVAPKGQAPENTLAKAYGTALQKVTGKAMTGDDLVGIYTFDAIVSLDRAIERAKTLDTAKLATAMSAAPPIDSSSGPVAWGQDRSAGTPDAGIGIFRMDSDLSHGSVQAP